MPRSSATELGKWYWIAKKKFYWCRHTKFNVKCIAVSQVESRFATENGRCTQATFHSTGVRFSNKTQDCRFQLQQLCWSCLFSGNVYVISQHSAHCFHWCEWSERCLSLLPVCSVYAPGIVMLERPLLNFRASSQRGGATAGVWKIYLFSADNGYCELAAAEAMWRRAVGASLSQTGRGLSGKSLGFLSSEAEVKGEVCTHRELIVRQLPPPSPQSAYLSYRIKNNLTLFPRRSPHQ